MQKGKHAILVTASTAPIIYNQLPSQSRGAIRSVKTVLKSGGVKTIKTFNVPYAAKFEDKMEKWFSKINKFVNRNNF
jgi:hypothetical protein